MIQKALLSFFVLFYVSYSFANMVKLEWRHYTSSPSIKEQLSDYVFFKWDNKVDFTKGPFHFDSQFQFEYSLDRSQFVYFNIPELYLLYEYELEAPLYSLRSIEINIGRKVKQWSLGDEYWDLGLWNPLTRWNPLHPSTNGLVGSFFTVKADQWESDFFVGALYVPDQEVSVVEENGRIYSRSRWFPMLPSQVNSLNIDIHYSSGNPFIFDILFQQSFLFNFKTWSKTPEVFYWMKWSFADKPVNHLFFILNQNNRIQVEEEEGEVFVNQKITVLPVRQRILSTEWGLDYRDISIAFSLENTKMKEASIPPKYWSFVKERDNFTYFSALLKYDYLDNSFFRLAFIQSWFRRVDLSQGDPSLLVRSKILEGAGFDWQTKLFSYKEQPVFFALK
ncbi:MAG: hypothetical protein OXN83_01765 [Oligoflexia bacterium]|nr:hypothetical protein [Oligoflexia bacterium]